MKKYIAMMRLDHWIKQLFIVPGCVAAVFLSSAVFSKELILKIIFGFFATCFIASANYVINEWLDAEFDKFHPTKKYRSVVTEDVKGKTVWFLWIVLSAAGFAVSYLVNVPFLLMSVWLWVMGIVYNVKPIRTKDIPFLDVLSESVNNAIRLLMGWFIVSDTTVPPSSLIFGYWMTGSFLMATKRFAEYRMINDESMAGKYRKSFKYYSERSLLISAFFYAMCSVFFVGVFLIKYRTELVLIIPVFIGLFCYYLNLSFLNDSSVQKPEKLFREKGLMVYCFVLIVLFIVLIFVDIPVLSKLTSNELIALKKGIA